MPTHWVPIHRTLPGFIIDPRLMQFPNARIALFAKAPEAGKVKTRLLPAVSAEEAAVIYSGLLQQTVANLARARLAPIDCWCTPDVTHPFFQNLVDEFGVSLKQQKGDDLGQRMRTAVAKTSAESVILIGGDCPVLEPDHLNRAFSWLQGDCDAVLGPAEDGGYVLLGLNRCDESLFNDIPWGGERVLLMTRERLQQLNWRWRELEVLWDLDPPPGSGTLQNYF